MEAVPQSAGHRLAVRYWLARWDMVRKGSHIQQALFLHAALAADGGRGAVLELVLHCLADARLTLSAMAVLAAWQPPAGMDTGSLVEAWLKRLKGLSSGPPYRAVVWEALAVLDGGDGRLASWLLEAVTTASEDELFHFLPRWRPVGAGCREALKEAVARRLAPLRFVSSSRTASMLKTVLLELEDDAPEGLVWWQVTGCWKPSCAVDGAALRAHLARLTQDCPGVPDPVRGWQGRLLLDRGRGEWVDRMTAEVCRRPVDPAVLAVLADWQPESGVETGALAAAWLKVGEEGLALLSRSRSFSADAAPEVLSAWRALVHLDGGRGVYLEAFCRAVSSCSPLHLLETVAKWKPATDEVEVAPLWEAWVNLLRKGGVTGARTAAFRALLHLDRGRGWLLPLLLEWFPVITEHDGLRSMLCRWEPRSRAEAGPALQELISNWRELVSHPYVTHACAAWEALFRLLESEEQILHELASRLPLEWREKVLRVMHGWWPAQAGLQEACFRLWAGQLGNHVYERRLTAFAVTRRRLAFWVQTHPQAPEILPRLLSEFEGLPMSAGNWLRQVILAQESGLDPQAALYVGLGASHLVPDEIQHLLGAMVDWRLGQCLVEGSGMVGLARYLQDQWIAMEEGAQAAYQSFLVPAAWKAFWQPFLSALCVTAEADGGMENSFVPAGIRALAAWVEGRSLTGSDGDASAVGA